MQHTRTYIYIYILIFYGWAQLSCILGALPSQDDFEAVEPLEVWYATPNGEAARAARLEALRGDVRLVRVEAICACERPNLWRAGPGVKRANREKGPLLGDSFQALEQLFIWQM